MASWVKAHGGTADAEQLHLADASVISPNLKMVGVLHPGGAAKGGAVAAIIASFKAAITKVHEWADDDPGWLPVDTGATRSSAASYTYSSDPIPFRDFPYGTAWRLGRGGTSSNRRDNQRGIQIFSEHGKYNNEGHTLSYQGSVAGTATGYDAPAGDLAWEPPRQAHADFDRGPGTKFAQLLQGGAVRLRLAGLQVVRVEVRAVVRDRADLQGTARQAEHPRARRPGVARRPVHDAGVERRCRPTPAGVPHGSRRHQEVRHPARPARRHARRRSIAHRRRRSTRQRSVRSTPRRCGDPSPRSCSSSVRSPSACAPTSRRRGHRW